MLTRNRSFNPKRQDLIEDIADVLCCQHECLISELIESHDEVLLHDLLADLEEQNLAYRVAGKVHLLGLDGFALIAV